MIADGPSLTCGPNWLMSPASARFGVSDALQSSLELPEFENVTVPCADASDHTPDAPLPPVGVVNISVQLSDIPYVTVPSGVTF